VAGLLGLLVFGQARQQKFTATHTNRTLSVLYPPLKTSVEARRERVLDERFIKTAAGP
jgi:hypothetical protein